MSLTFMEFFFLFFFSMCAGVALFIGLVYKLLLKDEKLILTRRGKE